MKQSKLTNLLLSALLLVSTYTMAWGEETSQGNYQLFCAQCHGTLSNGQGINQTAGGLNVSARDHTNTVEMAKLTDEEIKSAIAEGGKFVDKSSLMPAFKESLSPSEIDELVQYLRQLCAC